MITVTEVVHKWIPNPAITYSASMVRLLVSVTTSTQPFDTLYEYVDHLHGGKLDKMLSTYTIGEICVYQPEYDRYDISDDDSSRMYSASAEFSIHWHNKFNCVTTQVKK